MALLKLLAAKAKGALHYGMIVLVIASNCVGGLQIFVKTAAAEPLPPQLYLSEIYADGSDEWVENNGFYNTDLTITWDNGSGLLNGNVFNSGVITEESPISPSPRAATDAMLLPTSSLSESCLTNAGTALSSRSSLSISQSMYLNWTFSVSKDLIISGTALFPILRSSFLDSSTVKGLSLVSCLI